MLFFSIVFCFDDPFGFSVDSTASDPFSQIQGVRSPTKVISTTILTLVALPCNQFFPADMPYSSSLSGLRAYPSLPQQLHLLTLQSTRSLATFPQTWPSRSPLLRKCNPHILPAAPAEPPYGHVPPTLHHPTSTAAPTPTSSVFYLVVVGTGTFLDGYLSFHSSDVVEKSKAAGPQYHALQR